MRLFFRLYSLLAFLMSPILLFEQDLTMSTYLLMTGYFTFYTYSFMALVCPYDLMESLNKRIKPKRTIPKATARKQKHSVKKVGLRLTISGSGSKSRTWITGL